MHSCIWEVGPKHGRMGGGRLLLNCLCAGPCAVQAAAQEGSTRPPGLDEMVALHFVALAHRGGRLLELDGRKPFPIDHGASSPGSLLQVNVTVQ
jgi:hypothetical protein